MHPAVSILDLHKTFHQEDHKVGKAIHAVCGVNLEVPEGEIFGFLGPNGAGKTTTLRILTTLLPFEKGEAIVAGVDVKKNPHEVRRRIGYVSQKGGADPRATGWENLILQGRLYGMEKREVLSGAKDLVETFSLQECIDRIVETYSGGQKRRLDIALAMMHRPKLLFLDEPTNGLDPQNRSNLWAKILELKSQGVTIFLTSHYLEEVDALADSLAIIDHGKIVAHGSPTHLKKQISGEIITIGLGEQQHAPAMQIFEEKKILREMSSSGHELRLFVDQGSKALPDILRLLDQSQIQFETIQMSLPSLNDVFLKKTGRSLREDPV